MRPGVVADACNPALWKAEVGRSSEVRILRPAWPAWWNPVSTKYTKISQTWWCAAIVPATQEAEVGRWLEPRRRRLQWAEITSLHSSLGDRARPCLNKQIKKNSRTHSFFYSRETNDALGQLDVNFGRIWRMTNTRKLRKEWNFSICHSPHTRLKPRQKCVAK